METGKAVRGTTKLAFDAAHSVTTIVEEMYRNIAATPFPLGSAPKGRAAGIAGFVHESVRQVIGATGRTSDWLLTRAAPGLDRTLPPGPRRQALICALNGVCGDHLAKTENPLAIPMQLRVLLPQAKLTDGADQSKGHAGTQSAPVAAASNLFDVERRSVEIYPQPIALADNSFSPTGRLLILAHGLSMNELAWTSHQHNHGEALAENGSYTPIYALYNSGRHISTNGREFCEQLAGLVANWPVPVESITFIGFSMGGLVTRSAMHIAKQEDCQWLSRVNKVVYVGTPHHGAVMERGGYWLQKGMTFSPYTAPLSALGRIRSAGITDLRHGNVQDDDWQHHDEHEDRADNRRPTPLLCGMEHYAIAATLSKESGAMLGRLLGDGLVHPSSATGRHSDPEFDLAIPAEHTKILYDLGHLAMLHDPRVMSQLTQWLTPG